MNEWLPCELMNESRRRKPLSTRIVQTTQPQMCVRVISRRYTCRYIVIAACWFRFLRYTQPLYVCGDRDHDDRFQLFGHVHKPYTQTLIWTTRRSNVCWEWNGEKVYCWCLSFFPFSCTPAKRNRINISNKQFLLFTKLSVNIWKGTNILRTANS